jgi:hypothetical protein
MVEPCSAETQHPRADPQRGETDRETTFCSSPDQHPPALLIVFILAESRKRLKAQDDPGLRFVEPAATRTVLYHTHTTIARGRYQ